MTVVAGVAFLLALLVSPGRYVAGTVRRREHHDLSEETCSLTM